MDWYYREDESGIQVGPLTDDEFDSYVKTGRVSMFTMVWNASMKGWQRYGEMQHQPAIGVKAPPAHQVNCSHCFRLFPENELIRYQNSWICASCKPIFMQRLKEGGSLPGVLNYAPFWPRFGAKFIDNIITSVGSMIIQFALLIPGAAMSTDQTLLGVLYIVGYLISISLNVAYYVYFLVKHSATPGKMALGLKVVTAEGEQVTMGTAIGRFFAELLSAMTCGIGYIMAAFDEEKRTLHDRLCNTRVVRK